ncbi:hypothetical protein H0H81_003148, partial [Sphagnurus paluster]
LDDVQDHFKIPYTYCGCPIPGDIVGQSIGQCLSALVKAMFKPSYLVPPKRDHLLAALHPSDHNAVFLYQDKAKGEAAQKLRRSEHANRLNAAHRLKTRKDMKDNKKGALVTPEEWRTAEERPYAHSPAFLVPVPMYYGYGTGCVAYSGNVVPSTGAGMCAVVSVMTHSLGAI